MVRSASHNRFAGYTVSHRTPADAHSHTGDQPAALWRAMPLGGSRPLPSHPAALLLRVWRLALAVGTQLSADLALDTDTSAPRLDASAATTTSAESPRHYA